MDSEQTKFEGWAVVDVMGHQRHIGFVTTEAYGQAVLFRVDTPQLNDREFVLTAPAYVKNSDLNGDADITSWCPAGSKVKRAASPARTVLIGSGSIYQITPCTEEAALHAIEKNSPRPLILIEMPKSAAVAELEPHEPEDEDQDNDEELDEDAVEYSPF